MKGYVRRRRLFSSGIGSVIVLWCLAAPAAIGASITYVFSGPASGSLGATPFTGAQTTVTGTADTVNIVGITGGSCIDLTSVAINIAGVGSATTTGPNRLFDAQGANLWGFQNGTCAAPLNDWLDVTDPLAGSYGLATSIGPTTGVQFHGNMVATTAGTLTFTAVPLTFQATLNVIPAVSQWGLLLLAFVLTGVGAFFLRGRTG